MRLFSCDSCLSLPGVLDAGMWDLAEGTLQCLVQAGRTALDWSPMKLLWTLRMSDPATRRRRRSSLRLLDCYVWTRDREVLKRIYPFAKSCSLRPASALIPENSGYFNGPA